MFALPGGFVGAEESPEQTAERKLREKTGVGSVHLEQLRTYAAPERDPRGWLPSIAYLALVAPEALPERTPAERDASWHPLDALPELALDHARIVDDGLWRLRARVADKAWFMRVGGGLLPEEFTLRQAQRLYEAIGGEARRPGQLPPRREGDGSARGHGPPPHRGPGPARHAVPARYLTHRLSPRALTPAGGGSRQQTRAWQESDAAARHVRAGLIGTVRSGSRSRCHGRRARCPTTFWRRSELGALTRRVLSGPGDHRGSCARCRWRRVLQAVRERVRLQRGLYGRQQPRYSRDAAVSPDGRHAYVGVSAGGHPADLRSRSGDRSDDAPPARPMLRTGGGGCTDVRGNRPRSTRCAPGVDGKYVCIAGYGSARRSPSSTVTRRHGAMLTQREREGPAVGQAATCAPGPRAEQRPESLPQPGRQEHLCDGVDRRWRDRDCSRATRERGGPEPTARHRWLCHGRRE